MDTNDLSYSVPGYRTPHHHRRALIRTLVVSGAVAMALFVGGVGGWTLHALSVAPAVSTVSPTGVPSPSSTASPSVCAVVPTPTVPAP